MKNLSAKKHLIAGSHEERGCHRGVPLRASDINMAKFNKKIDRSAGPTACWLWCGSDNGQGYGMFRVNKSYRLAHRCAAALAFGEVGAGLLVMHTCDNPPCVNPAHLRVATQSDNMRDRSEKGRAVYVATERNPVCWQHGWLSAYSCDLCQLEREKGLIESEIAARLEVRARFVARVRARLTFPLPSTRDDLAAIVGRTRALLFASHFGLYGFVPMRQAHLAKAAGVSRQRIDQIIDDVIDNLRQRAEKEAA
jgi:hypothetical protein